jgi:hypothetical protein
MLFKDISNFSRVSDYLPILTSIIFVDTFIMFLNLKNLTFKSKYLSYWYRHFGILAVMADVLIVMIVFILTRFLYPFIFSKFNILFFVLLLVSIQIIHDILFYAFFSIVPRGFNKMLDVFKDYAKETTGGAILGDSILMSLSALLASLTAGSSLNMNIVGLILTLYFVPYTLNA